MTDAGHVFPYTCNTCTDNIAQPIEPISPAHVGRERATRTDDRDPDSGSGNKRPRYEVHHRHCLFYIIFYYNFFSFYLQSEASYFTNWS